MTLPSRFLVLGATASLLWTTIASSVRLDDDRPVEFQRDVRPILSDRCFLCHGPDEAARQAGLRLDTFEGATAERPGGAAIAPGSAGTSELVARITSGDPDTRMPPAESKLALSDAEIELLRRWIDAGAGYARHWSLEAPSRSPADGGVGAGWARDSLDGHIAGALAARGLAPAQETDRATWLRRVSFDLTGLPPTPTELDAFLGDGSGQAYEDAVERLLASPHYGERMATDWLDTARYADTHGYQNDVARDVWPWRDWVVDAFNENLSWDRFATWQLAGDLLPEATREQRLATAFNRLHRQTNEGGSVEEEYRVEYVSDRVHTMGTAFLGLTLECARCHDHKFDPIEQEEYYALTAFFDNVAESGLYSHFTSAMPTPTLPLPSEEQAADLAELRTAILARERAVAAAKAEAADSFASWRAADHESDLAGIRGASGRFSFESIEQDGLANAADPERPGRTFEGPALVEGTSGNALSLSGEDNASFPGVGAFERTDPFTLAFWIWTPDEKERAVVLHRSRSWTDAGSQGYELLLEEGRLSAALIHFWPGNAIRVRASEPLSAREWHHVTLRYDGSSRAAGLELFLDGRPLAVEVARDSLDRRITGGGDLVLTLGQRFRDRGFRGGRIDELGVFDRRLSAAEIEHLATGVPLREAVERTRAAEESFYLAAVDPTVSAAREELRAARKQLAEALDGVREIMAMEELDEPRTTYVLARGSYLAPTTPVDPDTPACLPPFPADLVRNRLGLARWLTAPDHPLFARVAVNRLWRLVFGRGLVETVEDFGSQGSPPTHPELLDELALDFVASGHDVKAFLKRLVLSATYRQSSRASAEALRLDPDNRLYSRGPVKRLTAEMIRDNALFVSGLLVDRLGGPPVKPYQPAGLWKDKSGAVYTADEGEGLWRRSLYTFWKRTSPPPAMTIFDAALREVCVARRAQTDTPLQALALWNDPQQVEAARKLAERMLREGADDSERLALAFRRTTSRRPDAEELGVLLELLGSAREEYTAFPERAEALLATGSAPVDEGLEQVEVASMAIACGALLAYDGTIVLR